MTDSRRPAPPASSVAAVPEHRHDVDLLVAGAHHHPHAVLGPHLDARGLSIRVWNPAADSVTVVVGDPSEPADVPAVRIDPRGLHEARLRRDDVPAYTLRLSAGSSTWESDDPYRFLPTLGELDIHLIGEGSHARLWQSLGAHITVRQGVRGTAFAVWAPNARGVSVVGDHDLWNPRLHPMRMLGGSGIWELFIPGIGEGTRYKLEVTRADGSHVQKADPLARMTQAPPQNASVVTESHHDWGDADWIERRRAGDWASAPASIYEVHLGSWRRGEGDRVLGYREVGAQLREYCTQMGFTHVELLPVSEHPFTGSWGYQVSGYYAPTARYGSPDDLRAMIDDLHQGGIGVILDWVPAHFPKDEWALGRFDGTALYEHVDPRRGEQPDWGTYVFNYGRNEVRNFLVANARYWVEEFHIDGLRIDAVAAMLYLDYSRREGEWIPNPFGGRENLEAIDLLREVTSSLAAEHPGVLTIAEESTSWPGVTQDASRGGLGFSWKWNMGWMHDTFEYFSNDPIFRRFHHHQLTFGLWYAWSERFVLPLSHDEVVHGKGSLIGRMPGDAWQRFANLRSLLAWMWAHPGKQLLFMGGELAQEREWSEDRSLDWHLLDELSHAGVQRLTRDLNHQYAAHAALYERDISPDGFRWIDAGNADQNVLAFLRAGASGEHRLACVANFSPVVHHGFRVGMPTTGPWREVLNTDAEAYGGSGAGNLGTVTAVARPWHGLPCSAEMTLPPLSVLWLAPQG